MHAHNYYIEGLKPFYLDLNVALGLSKIGRGTARKEEHRRILSEEVSSSSASLPSGER
jgi:hypothetical protein